MSDKTLKPVVLFTAASALVVGALLLAQPGPGGRPTVADESQVAALLTYDMVAAYEGVSEPEATGSISNAVSVEQLHRSISPDLPNDSWDAN